MWHMSDTESSWENLQHWFCEFKAQFDYIHVDFTEAYCNGGCCRPIEHCVQIWIPQLLPKALDVTGPLVGEEAEFDFVPRAISLVSRTHTKHQISGVDDLKKTVRPADLGEG
jgi:hypothetical protein